jgi:hypothetical protein
VITREDIQRVMDQVPNLNDFGVGVFCLHQRDPEMATAELEQGRKELLNSAEAVAKVCEWLRGIEKTKTPTISSYYLKHVAEEEIGYVTNGVFIVAAILCGFPYRVNSGSPNVAFGVSERSIREREGARR